MGGVVYKFVIFVITFSLCHVESALNICEE